MEFGRVDGLVTLTPKGQRRISVLLDTGREVDTLRDQPVPDSLSERDVAVLAEQLVQEALGNELDLEGWQVIGEGDTSTEIHRLLDVVARSRTWVVGRG